MLAHRTAPTPLWTSPIVTIHYEAGLRARSGTLVVTRNDTSGVRASFDVELETVKGDHVISVTRGRIDLSDCGVRVVSSCYGH
jgi:hypothetical protein